MYVKTQDYNENTLEVDFNSEIELNQDAIVEEWNR